jgi:hypothetical protein
MLANELALVKAQIDEERHSHLMIKKECQTESNELTFYGRISPDNQN